MNIVKFAMQMELDGKAFYQQAAAAAVQPELRDILLYLADEEQRHFMFFKKLSEGDTSAAQEELTNKDASLKDTKNVFVQLTENGTETSFGDDARSTWEEALRIEEKAVKMYSEEALKESDPHRRALLERIADEERNHVYLIDSVLSFMTDPESFADSKKYSDFQSWEGH
ncbi:MAG: ferritin family protein [Candidatus Zixiibacteriota bacterium]|nr:MAG: ferritin family protein [candidate division Zixibacteria bacterium]